ncbi:unnamed protein product [Peniophora sp. CBMAI 1063]|nr:unnamed protein product [Peniophora sp. CBMAI 1063]
MSSNGAHRSSSQAPTTRIQHLLNFKEGIVAERGLDSTSQEAFDSFFEMFNEAPPMDFMMNSVVYGHVLHNEQRLKRVEDACGQILTGLDELKKAVSSQGRLTGDQEADVRKIAKKWALSRCSNMQELKDVILTEVKKKEEFKVLCKTGPGDHAVQKYVGEQASYIKNILRDTLLATTIGASKGGLSVTVDELKAKLTSKKPTSTQAMMILFLREYVRENAKALSCYAASGSTDDDAAARSGGVFFDLTDKAFKEAAAEYGEEFGETVEWQIYLDKLKRKELELWPENKFGSILPMPARPAAGPAPIPVATSVRNVLDKGPTPCPRQDDPTGMRPLSPRVPSPSLPPRFDASQSSSPASSGGFFAGARTPALDGSSPSQLHYSFNRPQVNHAGHPYSDSSAPPPATTSSGSPGGERRIAPLPRRSQNQAGVHGGNSPYHRTRNLSGMAMAGTHELAWDPVYAAANGFSNDNGGTRPASTANGYRASGYEQLGYNTSWGGSGPHTPDSGDVPGTYMGEGRAGAGQEHSHHTQG